MKKSKTIGSQRPEADIFKERRHFAEFQKIFSEYLRTVGDNISQRDLMEVSLQLAFSEAIITNADEAERLLRQCEEYILKYGKDEERAAVYHIRCRLHLKQSNFEQALEEGVRSLYMFQYLNFPFFIMNTSTCCGVICSILGLHSEAIDYISRSYTIAMQMGDKRAAILATVNLNDIRMGILPNEDSIRHGELQLIDIRQEYGDQPSMAEAGTCVQLAQLYMKTRKLDLSDSYVDRAFSLLSRLPHVPPHHFLYTNLYGTKAEIAACRGDEAGVKENTAEYSRRNKMKQESEFEVLLIQFKFYLERQDINTAKDFLDQADRAILYTDRSIDYLYLHENKCLYYQTVGDLAAEMKHFKIVHEYSIKAQQEALAKRAKYLTTVYELEIVQKEAEIQKKELEYKTQELNMTSFYLQQRNQLLSDLQENISHHQRQKSSAETIVKTISEKIKQAHAKEEAEKAQFKEKFDEAQRGFIMKLHELHSALSTTECRICALLRSGFNTKEIAHLLSSSSRTTENHRASIRRKMNLSRTDNLNMILAAIK